VKAVDSAQKADDSTKQSAPSDAVAK